MQNTEHPTPRFEKLRAFTNTLSNVISYPFLKYLSLPANSIDLSNQETHYEIFDDYEFYLAIEPHLRKREYAIDSGVAFQFNESSDVNLSNFVLGSPRLDKNAPGSKYLLEKLQEKFPHLKVYEQLRLTISKKDSSGSYDLPFVVVPIIDNLDRTALHFIQNFDPKEKEKLEEPKYNQRTIAILLGGKRTFAADADPMLRRNLQNAAAAQGLSLQPTL